MKQEIRFCRAGDGTRIAYALSGSGPPLVKSAHWLSHIGHDWDSPIWRHQLQDLSSRFRLLRYDLRGCGRSDRDVDEISLSAWVDDLACVVDNANLDRFALLGMSQGGPIAIEYAARHPHRVSHLVLFGSYARGRRHWPGLEQPEREADALASLVELGWGRDNPAYRQLFCSMFLPGADAALASHFNELQRRSAEPSVAARIVGVNDALAITDSARALRVPTLVMHCEDDARIPFAEGRELAGEIPGARFVPLGGRNHIILEGEQAWPTFLRELADFVNAEPPPPPISTALPADLTPREHEILELLATGLDTADIAARLHLSPKTVRNHLTRVFDKLSVSSRGQAIVAARRAGLGVSRPEG